MTRLSNDHQLVGFCIEADEPEPLDLSHLPPAPAIEQVDAALKEAVDPEFLWDTIWQALVLLGVETSQCLEMPEEFRDARTVKRLAAVQYLIATLPIQLPPTIPNFQTNG